jgi:hypothetical protein
MSQFVDYEKRKNQTFFDNLEKFDCNQTQNYLPIYKNFFNLSDTNYNNINLNHSSHIDKVIKKINENEYVCSIVNRNNKAREERVFCKFAPLIDPVKIMIGKYEKDNTIYRLPQLTSTTDDVHAKLLDINNSAYVDGVFSFLTGQLSSRFNFIHGVKYFGSFLTIKKKFKINVYDDLEYLIKSDYFNKHKNRLFEIENYSELFDDSTSRCNLPALKISHDAEISIATDTIEPINDDLFSDVFSEPDTEDADLCELDNSMDFLSLTTENINDHNSLPTNKEFSRTNTNSDDTCSSRTSHTNSKDEDSDNVSSDTEDSDDDRSEESDDEKIFATFPEFPVQMICMEACENTLDQLILDEELTQDKWLSALMQIIMILITYQKAFSFTHNDLHTNNIMYVSTKKKYLFYQIKNTIYRVPTFGKIFKIIDFGRAIYKYDGKVICSDSFSSTGDAATQYNIEPYYNEQKPRLEPNFSFDLCRLACSIFDYLIDDMSEIQNLKKCNAITRIIAEWCVDDNGINVLYKNNGTDRYPEFKLYKMIARCVHKHTPLAQLERPEFKAFSFQREKIPKNEYVINIDNIEV